jgi:succinylglutamic semialdehyde dehydrogenase
MPVGEQYIDRNWTPGSGLPLERLSPVDGKTTWRGPAAGVEQIDAAVHAARNALAFWARRPISERSTYLETFATELRERQDDLIDAISMETGKPRWESSTEIDAMIRKIPLSITAYRERRAASESETAGEISATRFKPHGVAAVFGPFNFPGHLPNGHIVPALLAGNTVIFKPSEQAPLVGELTMRAWEAADLPPGVLNLLHGAADVGAALATHRGVDGVFFTGSFAAGKSLSLALADQPGKLLALEMGGNNPLVVWNAGNVEAAAYLTAVSAFITAGQRCSCARRLIVPADREGDVLLEALVAATRKLRVGLPADRPEPFLGTVISAAAADRIVAAADDLLARGGISIVPLLRQPRNAALLSPGIIDVSNVPNRPDVEIFGPLLQVIRVKDWDAAIAEANNTSYGLCAGLLSDDCELYAHFYDSVRAGLINWNRPTTGASSALPFGGIGHSGNHRPSGSWAADYCSYPVASLEGARLQMPAQRFPGIDA